MISRAEFWRLFRFSIVGGGATLVDLATAKFCLFMWPAMSEHLVTSIGFFVAFWVSFFGHRYVTFQSHGKITNFLAVALFSLAVRNVLLSGLLWVGLSGMLPIVIATLAVTVLTYVLSRIWVFA